MFSISYSYELKTKIRGISPFHIISKLVLFLIHNKLWIFVQFEYWLNLAITLI